MLQPPVPLDISSSDSSFGFERVRSDRCCSCKSVSGVSNVVDIGSFDVPARVTRSSFALSDPWVVNVLAADVSGDFDGGIPDETPATRTASACTMAGSSTDGAHPKRFSHHGEAAAPVSCGANPTDVVEESGAGASSGPLKGAKFPTRRKLFAARLVVTILGILHKGLDEPGAVCLIKTY